MVDKKKKIAGGKRKILRPEKRLLIKKNPTRWSKISLIFKNETRWSCKEEIEENAK